MRTAAPDAAFRGYAWPAPMALWPLAQRVMPAPARRPQGGGTRRPDDEAVFASVLYVLVSGSSWRGVPGAFGTPWQTAHRRFLQLCDAGLWERLEEAAGVPGTPPHLRHWATVVRRAAAARRTSRSTAGAPTA
ncbi:transposase [Streptomyces sp. NPDC035033]|uniref:transposase n=1 Tax=Streptomyces sp. NPDC035033 TaxID=3155368 RepID=UPI0033F8FC29